MGGAAYLGLWGALVCALPSGRLLAAGAGLLHLRVLWHLPSGILAPVLLVLQAGLAAGVETVGRQLRPNPGSPCYAPALAEGQGWWARQAPGGGEEVQRQRRRAPRGCPDPDPPSARVALGPWQPPGGQAFSLEIPGKDSREVPAPRCWAGLSHAAVCWVARPSEPPSGPPGLAPAPPPTSPHASAWLPPLCRGRSPAGIFCFTPDVLPRVFGL